MVSETNYQKWFLTPFFSSSKTVKIICLYVIDKPRVDRVDLAAKGTNHHPFRRMGVVGVAFDGEDITVLDTNHDAGMAFPVPARDDEYEPWNDK